MYFSNWGRIGFDGGREVSDASGGAGGLLKTRKNIAANDNVEVALAA